jgi:hypothetical protein
MKSTEKNKKNSLFRIILSGIGCFIIYPAMALVLITLFGWLVFSTPYRLFSTAVMLPELELPTDSDFWHFQEKTLDAQASGSNQLLLSISEYNAYLNRVVSAPKAGFYHQKTRFLMDENHLIFYLAGSGFMQKILNIRLEFKHEEPKADSLITYATPNKIFFNKLMLDKKSFMYKVYFALYTKIVEFGDEVSFKEVVLKNLPVIQNGKVVLRLN